MRRKRVRAIRYQIELYHEPGRRLDSLAPYADALVLLHGDSALDEALTLAHNINTAAHQFEAEQLRITARVAELRAQLAAIEKQGQASREP